MNIKELLNNAINKLKDNSIDEPVIKAKILLSYVLNQPKQYLLTHDLEEINNDIVEKYNHYISLLISNVPLQYIRHSQEFMKIDFYVDENVLIPRADTEILVEEVLNLSKKIENPKILDLCTGSGAIAISLMKYIGKCKIYASDISQAALKVAKRNAKSHEVKVTFIKSDLFCNVDKKFDIIVSNPPYIKTGIISTLDKQVQNEPILALNGGNDGLNFYKQIIENAHRFLNDKGYLCLEIGFDQKEEVINLLKQQHTYIDIYSKKDLSNNDRIVICRKE